jgi:hypothetical protein
MRNKKARHRRMTGLQIYSGGVLLSHDLSVIVSSAQDAQEDILSSALCCPRRPAGGALSCGILNRTERQCYFSLNFP